MNPANFVLLGLKNSVTAFHRQDGQILWTTPLPGNGSDFVTLHVDGLQLFAHTQGRLFCLELTTGRILWSNPLKGLGYGIATLATLGNSVLTPAQAQAIALQQES